MNSKKAQGMSMNVIIIAALALIVFVVLGVIFMGKAGNFKKESSTCQNNGGKCIAKGTCTGDYQKQAAYGCLKADQKTIDDTLECCVTV
jgi:flagellar basal body-associated protein FliL